MFIQIESKLTTEQMNCKETNSFCDYEKIRDEIMKILENTNTKDLLPLIQEEKKKFTIDEITTKYIFSTFNKKIPLEERKEILKKIIKGIFEFGEYNLAVWENNGQIRILPFII